MARRREQDRIWDNLARMDEEYARLSERERKERMAAAEAAAEAEMGRRRAARAERAWQEAGSRRREHEK